MGGGEGRNCKDSRPSEPAGGRGSWGEWDGGPREAGLDGNDQRTAGVRDASYFGS